MPKTSMPLRHVGCPEMLALVEMSGWLSAATMAFATADLDCRSETLGIRAAVALDDDAVQPEEEDAIDF